MPLAQTGDLVAEARRGGRGVGAFNVIGLEVAEGLVAGAEAAGRPVILAISENTVRFHGRLGPVAVACLALANGAGVPVAVHLDHATDEGLVEEALALGLRSVMFDASAAPFAENIRRTRAVAARCHAAAAWVEAELGEVGGKDGVHAPGARTDPVEAAAYVTATGVDALAVAVGTSHAMRTQDAAPDLARIADLREAVAVPLVLHGSSGVADEDLRRAIAAGITKVNVATRLNAAFTAAVRAELREGADAGDPRPSLRAGRAAIAAEAERLLRLIAGA